MYSRITIILTAILIGLSTIPASAVTDFEAPVLTGVAVDETSVDVSSGYKVVTFTLSAADASDAKGYKSASMRLTLVKPDGSSLAKYLYMNRSIVGANDAGGYAAQTMVAGTLIHHTSNQLVLSNEDLAGTWILDYVGLEDSPGNFRHVERADLDALGISLSVQLLGGVTDFEAPVLTGVAVDETSVDVSSGYKVVTFTLSAADASDAKGYKSASMRLTLVKPGGSSLTKYLYMNRSIVGANDAGGYAAQTMVAGTLIHHTSNQLVLSNEDLAGTWVLDYVGLEDSPGNFRHVERADLDALGIKSVVVNLNDGVVSVGDLSLIAASPYESVYSKTVPAGGSSSTSFGGTSVAISNTTLEGNDIWVTADGHDFSSYSFSIRNKKASRSKEVALKIYSKGVYRAGFNQSAGTSSCATTLNTDDLETVQTCVLSAFSENETRSYLLSLGTLKPTASAKLNLEVYTSDPDSDGSDNHMFYDFRINYDNDQDGVGNDQDAFPNDGSEILDTDGDGIGDNSDNCSSVANRNQKDLDGDGRGDSCDDDDDGDGLSDATEASLGTDPLLTDSDSDGSADNIDAFPTDATETLDTDSDGVGNNADLDDDNDSLSDIFEISAGRDPRVADYALSSSWAHSCAIHDGGIRCWGSDSSGQSSPPDVKNPKEIGTGGYFSCALLNDGSASCWGENAAVRTPVGAGNSHLTLGGYHACVIDKNGLVQCVGRNDYGESTVPSLSNASQVSAGNHFTCALDDNGVSCWGDNRYGQTSIPALSNPTKISSGQDHVCAQDDNGITCWGRNDNLQAETGSAPGEISSFDAGGYHNCAITSNNQVECWSQGFPTLNIPNFSNPVLVSSGSTFSCALDDFGIKCWGERGSENRTAVPTDLFFGDEDLDGVKDDVDPVTTKVSFDEQTFTVEIKAKQEADNPVDWIDFRLGPKGSSCFIEKRVTKEDSDDADFYVGKALWSIGENYSSGQFGVISDTPRIKLQDGTETYDQSEYFVDLDNTSGILPTYSLVSSTLTKSGDSTVISELVVSGFGEDGFLSAFPGSTSDAYKSNIHLKDGASYVGVTLDPSKVEKISDNTYKLTTTHTISNSEDYANPRFHSISLCDASMNGKEWNTDSDQDGIIDGIDAFPLDATEAIDTDSDGTGDNADTDDDGDRVEDTSDAFPLDATETLDTDSDGIGNNSDDDDDGDGLSDATEASLGTDPLLTDSDSDGSADKIDAFPTDATETLDTDSDGVGNNADTDDDGDGAEDSSDAFPLDSTETLDRDSDGIGNNADADDDGDGVEDTLDAFPLDKTETVDTDADGIGNNADGDDDNDGVPDYRDDFPLIALGGFTDTDSDGRPNDCNSDCQALGMSADFDDDGDSVLDTADAFPLDKTETVDTDADGFGNNADGDDDNDGVPDYRDDFPLIALGGFTDTDSDGRPNDCNSDCQALGMSADFDDDDDGMSDALELENGLNPLDGSDCPAWFCTTSRVYLYKIAADNADSDGDGLTNKREEELGTDKNDADSDADGLADGLEVDTYKTDPLNPDSDGDGLSDGSEVNTYGTQPLNDDTDGDSVSDGDEIQEDLDPTDANDCPDWLCGGSRPWLYQLTQ